MMQQQPRRVEQQEQRTHKQGHWSEQRQKTQWGRVLQLCLRVAFDQYGASQQQLAPPKSTTPLLLTAGTSAGTCAAAAHASVPAAPDEGLDAILANSPIRSSLVKQGKPQSQFLSICHTPVFFHLSLAVSCCTSAVSAKTEAWMRGLMKLTSEEQRVLSRRLFHELQPMLSSEERERLKHKMNTVNRSTGESSLSTPPPSPPRNLPSSAPSASHTAPPSIPNLVFSPPPP